MVWLWNKDDLSHFWPRVRTAFRCNRIGRRINLLAIELPRAESMTGIGFGNVVAWSAGMLQKANRTVKDRQLGANIASAWRSKLRGSPGAAGAS